MNAPGFISTIGLIGVSILLAAIGCLGFRHLDPQTRLEHEHGLHLPASATSIECRGDAWIGFLDRGASSSFVIAANELETFVSQLKIEPRGHSFIPSNWQYQLHAAWRKGVPISTYACDSPVGDWLHVEVWPVDQAQVGVCLYTDWN